MLREKLPITALPAWSKLNDVNFLDICVQDLKGSKGFGLVTERRLCSKDTFDIPTLMSIPHDLVLSAETVEEFAKVDQHLRQLLDVAGGKTTRGDVMLFLLMQITIASMGHNKLVGLSNPWTEYVKMLPDIVPVPTLWTTGERAMLVGTSLESALEAKMASLLNEFETLHEQTMSIAWCQKCWWETEALEVSDWYLLDAWYRSRCLELPRAKESMVPCIDMVNHSPKANAYYGETPSNGVSLLLRPDMELQTGAEVTISYGDSKTEAEMLFSYGFIDEESTSRGLTLPLEPLPNDPLGKAKAAAFSAPPVVRISDGENNFLWEGPFLYFSCLNEEDGLEFRVLQDTNGSRSHLKVFWQGSDVTDTTDKFEFHLKDHDLEEVFQLRVVALLLDRIVQQLDRLYQSDDAVQSLSSIGLVTQERQETAMQLRKSESVILEKAFRVIGFEKNKLLKSDVVLRYLGLMEGEEGPELDEEGPEQDEEEDLS